MSVVLRLISAFMMLCALGGCLGTGGGTGALSLRSAPVVNEPLKSTGLAQAVLVKNRVTVRGPKGFCVDSEAIQRKANSGFALLAPCAALGVKGVHPHVPVALLTIQAQPSLLQKDVKDAETLADVFAELGPIYTETGDGISLIQLSRGGDRAMPGGDPKHWRAVLNFNGSQVGLTVYPAKDSSAAGAAGKALLLAFAEEVLDASPLKSAQPVASNAQTETPAPKNLRKLFGKMFN